MKLEAETIPFAVSVAFFVIGVIDYSMNSDPFFATFIVSFLALLVTVGIKVIERELDNMGYEDLTDKEVDELKEYLNKRA